MKLKKLIAQTEEFLNTEDRRRKDKKKHLKQVLKGLRGFEDKLNLRLQSETDPDTVKVLERKAALAHAQRKKGIGILKSLKKKNT